MKKFKKYSSFDLSEINDYILAYWQKNKIFEKSLDNRKNNFPYIFFEGPPSANGKPGIHHVMARTIKDLFCRYKTLQGFKVDRKAGWDTHGLPVELGVEEMLNITKEDIGKSISIKEYNDACRKNVMKYKHMWEKITKEMGYWVNMKDPYVTYDNKYIESVWWLLKKMHQKNVLYKGHTIQPFSPKAGTGLSTHELNQPGCYKNIKDTTAVAQFKLLQNHNSKFLYKQTDLQIYFLAWTTTPWTLPSNTALAVGKNIEYLLIETFNKYTGEKIAVIIAKELLTKFFNPEFEVSKIEKYSTGEKKIPYRIVSNFSGKALTGLSYDQLLKYKQPTDGEAFKVLIGDFVTTEDGTGIVHIAPSFGSDDNRLAKQNNIGSLTLVDKQGRFTKDVTDFSGMYVKNEYYSSENMPDLSADIQIVIKLKQKGLCFHSEKYEHSYPHCWRTDKPILYYPMDSWFVKTTDYKEKMIALNNTINWKPKSTGEGRFGNWLENLVDWNLSRSRFWGIPIPIWRTDDGKNEICVGSIKELKEEINKSIKAGNMSSNPLEKFEANNFSDDNYSVFDLHRPFVDEIILTAENGEAMTRELDLIDVWFDSGSMPYAQLHYPFENKKEFETNFPADFIAEGVDQTRGWFFTLHAISTILFDNISFKNVISNGLVLDKDGNKMSKRLGNTVDPFKTLKKYSADATRWYMITNSQPWDNLKFNELSIQEVQRKFFGTIFNTYSFFSLYANIDSFNFSEKYIPVQERDELDRWILSELNSLIKTVETSLDKYESNKATREIQNFVINKLSNWYVRLSRRRFWKGDYNLEKISAYQTLYECLEKIAIISSPIAPFFMDNLFQDLNNVTNKLKITSVHLANYPKIEEKNIDLLLEKKMQLAQNITSLALSIRKKENIRVRQPLQKILIPVVNNNKNLIKNVETIILNEINVKEIEYLNENNNVLRKQIKANFKTLGPKFGKQMKEIASKISALNDNEIKQLEKDNLIQLDNGTTISINDVIINTKDIPGYSVASNEGVTVALDIHINENLKSEGLAREFVNRIQNYRKDNSFEVTDKITLNILKDPKIMPSFQKNLNYICDETLAEAINFIENLDGSYTEFNLINSITAKVKIQKSKYG